MSPLERNIVNLCQQLLPSGRAFRIFSGSEREKYYAAIARTEAKAFTDAKSVLRSLLPDNDDFTPDDATEWERRLGINSNPLTSLPNRKLAIRRKLSQPGTVAAKSHRLYLEKQLQDAGFTNLYVYENIPEVNPASLNALILTERQHGPFQHGGIQSHYLNHVVVNSIYNSDDINFDFGANMQAAFFIGAGPSTPGVYANVPASREVELRQLILTIKQVQNPAILYINYV
jgi:hypothetical protein